MHTLSPKALFSAAPFYHFNQADYDSLPTDYPVSTTWHQTSNYAGGQADAHADAGPNSFSAGLYSFFQAENDLFGVSRQRPMQHQQQPNCNQPDANAGLVEFYLADHLRLGRYITLLGGERFSIYRAWLNESAIYPRIGATVEIPRLHWVLRGFYGHFFQPAPIADRLQLRAQLRQPAWAAARTPSRRFPPSATRSTSSAFRFPTGAGCSTWPTSKIA